VIAKAHRNIGWEDKFTCESDCYEAFHKRLFTQCV